MMLVAPKKVLMSPQHDIMLNDKMSKIISYTIHIA